MVGNLWNQSAVLWHLHMMFVGAVLFGAILWLVWLVKEGKREKIMQIVWITVVVGLIGLFLTAGSGLRYWGSFKGMMGNQGNQGGMMQQK